MLKLLPTKFEYNIPVYKLNVYKTSTKQPQIIYGWVAQKISILRIK